jgi:putative permease
VPAEEFRQTVPAGETPWTREARLAGEERAEQATKKLRRAQKELRDYDPPLSYGDLRRFFGLVAMVAVGYLLLEAVAATLILFAVVFLLALLLNPLVAALEKRRCKRPLAVVLIIVLLLGSVVGAGALVVPPILDEVNGLAERAPTLWKSIEKQSQSLEQRYPALDKYLPELDKLQETRIIDPSRLTGYLQRVLSYTFGVVGALFGGLIALLLLVFTLLNPKPLVVGALSAIPERHREASARSLARLQVQMTAWARATLINGVLTGVSTGLLMHLIGVKPALVFGVLAFFGEFVPNVGPLVASAPALFVALGEGTNTFGLALAAVLFVQQVESNLLVPFIMGRSMELHPVTIVFFAVAMGSILGVVGAILAVPAAALAKILIDEFYLRPQKDALAATEQAAGDIVACRYNMDEDQN